VQSGIQVLVGMCQLSAGSVACIAIWTPVNVDVQEWQVTSLFSLHCKLDVWKEIVEMVMNITEQLSLPSVAWNIGRTSTNDMTQT